MVGLTSLQALKERANLKAGQKVFIPAGSGGIGTFAIQLAKYLGAKVGTTTSTANVDLVRSFGADEVVDYKKQEFEEVLRDYDAGARHCQGRCAGKVASNSKTKEHRRLDLSGHPTPRSLAREA